MLICAAFAAHAWALHFTADDAYISFRYADNWAKGNGCVYQPGERVEGYTNFGWIALLAASRWAGADIELAAVTLGLASGVALLVCLFRFCSQRLSPAYGLGCCALLAMFGPMAAWTSAGLETASFSLLVFLSVTSFVKGLRTGQLRFSTGVLFALTALTRPDGVLVAVGLMLAAVAVRPRCLRSAWRPGLSFAFIGVPYFIWRLAYYGQFWPNTYYVKVATVTTFGLGRAYLFWFVREYPFVLLALLPLAAAAWQMVRGRVRDRDEETAVCFGLVTILYMAYVVRTDGDWMPLYRRFVPLLPLISYLVAASVAMVNRALAQSPSRAIGRLWRPALASGVLLSAVDLAMPSIEEAMGFQRSTYECHGITAMRELTRAGKEIGLWLRSHALPEDRVATRAAGALAYFSGLVTIGFHGLTDAHLARHGDVSRFGWPGHKINASHEYILSKHPTFIIEHPTIGVAPSDKVDPSTLYPGFVSVVFSLGESGRFAGCAMRTSEFERRAERLPAGGFALKRRAEGGAR